MSEDKASKNNSPLRTFLAIGVMYFVALLLLIAPYFLIFSDSWMGVRDIEKAPLYYDGDANYDIRLRVYKNDPSAVFLTVEFPRTLGDAPRRYLVETLVSNVRVEVDSGFSDLTASITPTLWGRLYASKSFSAQRVVVYVPDDREKELLEEFISQKESDTYYLFKAVKQIGEDLKRLDDEIEIFWSRMGVELFLSEKAKGLSNNAACKELVKIGVFIEEGSKGFNPHLLFNNLKKECADVLPEPEK